MRLLRSFAVAAVSLAAAVPALANMGGSSTPEPKLPSSSPAEMGSTLPTPRQQAERAYGDAYNEIAKAKKDVADKKDKNAEKRFRKALDRAQTAVELDSAYYQAWNLVGYASRKLKNHDGAVAAYTRSLNLKYDYAPAREYLGEAYLEMGKLDKAREQLALLEKINAAPEAVELKAAIDGYVAAHPEVPATPEAVPAGAQEAVAAPADTAKVDRP